MPDIVDIAARIRASYTGPAIASLREEIAADDVETAYAVQDANTTVWQAEGRRIVGRKIGLTSKTVQQQLGVDQPDFGVLFEDMRIQSGGMVAPRRLLQPKAEAEVALILKHDLTSTTCTPSDVAEATDYACCAIEIVDSRIRDWNITFADTVCDNGSSAFFLLGETRKALTGLDLYSCGMVMELNGEICSVGAGGACLGHPLKAAAWLANTLARRHVPLRAGDILLTGALGPMVAFGPGDHVRAVIGGLGECSFACGGDDDAIQG